jgi:hypothetical protein
VSFRMKVVFRLAPAFFSAAVSICRTTPIL